MVYLKQNERTKDYKSNMTPKTRKILQNWLWADYQLYTYFKTKFEKTVEELQDGEYLQFQLEELNYLNQNIKEKCNAKVVDNESMKNTVNHMSNDMVKAYTVIENCTYFVISEPSFFNEIRKTYREGKPQPQPIW